MAFTYLFLQQRWEVPASNFRKAAPTETNGKKIEQNVRYLFKVPRHAILYFIKMCAASANTDPHSNSQLELEHSPFILGRENH